MPAVGSDAYGCNGLHPCSIRHPTRCSWADADHFDPAVLRGIYVFGDLQKPNILCDADGKVKLIDFNWCGRYDMNICDEKLLQSLQNQINENMNHIQVGNGPYAYYPLSMSMLEGMWALGMESLTQIRPQHNWMMLDKLLW